MQLVDVEAADDLVGQAAEQMLMGEPDRLAGVDESVERVDQNGSVELRDVLLERVQLARVEHDRYPSIPCQAPIGPWSTFTAGTSVGRLRESGPFSRTPRGSGPLAS